MRALVLGLSLVLGLGGGAAGADRDRSAARHCGVRDLVGGILNPLACRAGRRLSPGAGGERERFQREALARQELHERVLRLHREIGLGPAAVATAAEIGRAQRLLTALGHYRGPIDGIAGTRTRAGVRRFEALQGLPPTGIVTPGIVDRMRAAL